MNNIFARISNNGEKQLIKDHLFGVAKLSEEFAISFCKSKLAYYIGLLHDIGKYSDAFQRRLQGSNEKVDHSTAGLQLCNEKYKYPFTCIMGYCIAGHHGGLPNYGGVFDISSLLGRLKKEIEDYSRYKNDIDTDYQFDIEMIANILKGARFPDYTLSFYIRMLFSCLVDADFLDTERFMNKDIDRSINYDFEIMNSQLCNYLKQFSSKKGKINEKRAEILNQCINHSFLNQGIYRLYVPTGGGKTLSSLAFALNHLLKHNLKRIIYVIPYTSIIEQTAKIFKDIFGEDKVLEHHYNFNYQDSEDDINEDYIKLKLATQNWDYPIIITTNVQFFESLYSNKPSKCRKLHNIAESVIIFDEVQMFPYDFIKPCLLAIEELVTNYKVTALFCSATQADFSSILNIKVNDIINNTYELNQIFKRVQTNYIGNINKNELVKLINNHPQVLTIVNTRKMVYDLYSEYGNNDVFCLSTLLTPADRKKAINEIKQRLQNNKSCQVISTQLIEAGVDIDFPVVYRSMAGLDSIVQSAGRCNREGKLSTGLVNIFILNEEKVRGHIEQGMAISKMLVNKYSDLTSIEAINEYYQEILSKRDLDENKIVNCFVENEKSCYVKYQFKDAAEKFKLIDNNQIPIIIPTANNEKLIENLKYVDNPRNLLNQLQQDTVLVYEYEFQKLFNDKKIIQVIDGIFILSDYELYNDRTGLNVFYKDNLEPLIC